MRVNSEGEENSVGLIEGLDNRFTIGIRMGRVD
jgi:hypothetical protein